MKTFAQRQVRGPLGKPIAVTLDGVTHHVRCLGGTKKTGVHMDGHIVIARSHEFQIAAADLPRALFAGDTVAFEGRLFQLNEEAAEDHGMLLLESVTVIGLA